jgi:predicted TIM-barrel fold metal-dependent hydrolase
VSTNTHSADHDEDESLSLVDTDVHQTYRREEEIAQYLPPRYENTGVELPGRLYNNPNGVLRGDAAPDDGGQPGSTVENIRAYLLDEYDIDYGILTGDLLSACVLPNRDYATALANAYNEWLIDEWLSGSDDRLLGSVLVAPQDPEKAAETIREYGSHPRMVQVIMNSASRGGYGQPFYWPIYEAAEEMGLPMAIHPANQGAGISAPPTGVGYPRSYFERHNAMPILHIAQLNSLVSEGVFVEFPDLQWAFIECGFTWVPMMLWRLDKDWKGLRDQVPWMERPPSEYVIENVRFTTQPIAEPEKPEHLRQILEMMHAEETLMFSSDYPHWDNDDPGYGLPRMDEPMRSRVRYGNAQELYDLPNETGATTE